MPQFSDFNFASSSGFHKIHARLCVPDGEVRGVVQIAHGIAEYIDRYDPFMSFLAENGFVAVGNDHLGHGKSISVPEDLGIFAENDGWDYVLRDMDKLHDMMVEKYPGVPYIFFGHSMGSFLTRHYAILHPDKPSLVIICGTGHQLPPMVNAGCFMANTAVKLFGPRKVGKTLNQVAFGSYNKGYEKVRTACDWLNRDEKEVDKYVNDPLCGFVPSVSMFRDMMNGIKAITDPANIARMNKKTPVLFISGGSDPVGENGAGVERAYKAFCDAGLEDVKMKLYPGARHEILLELNHDEVFADVLGWINEKLPG
ncbi:MAG: lysophospholipase [Oscillospiraceae bacterium]|nr:lysophospholipase [Oscillospiraceae bacterium]